MGVSNLWNSTFKKTIQMIRSNLIVLVGNSNSLSMFVDL